MPVTGMSTTGMIDMMKYSGSARQKIRTVAGYL